MKGIPAHARSEETAQIILGSLSALVEIVNPNAIADPDDERELFVAACVPTQTWSPTKR
jgi:hypothetical protein